MSKLDWTHLVLLWPIAAAAIRCKLPTCRRNILVYNLFCCCCPAQKSELHFVVKLASQSDISSARRCFVVTLAFAVAVAIAVAIANRSGRFAQGQYRTSLLLPPEIGCLQSWPTNSNWAAIFGQARDTSNRDRPECAQTITRRFVGSNSKQLVVVVRLVAAGLEFGLQTI